MSLSDIDHWFGGDVFESLTGDLATVSGITRSNQRIIRRLLTNPGSYIWHPEYGAGLGQFVGQPVNIPVISALITSQLLLESCVAKTPAPTVTIALIAAGIQVSIVYTETTTGQSVPLSFTVS